MADEAKAEDTRACTCYPGERPVPCQRKYASGECWRSFVSQCTQRIIERLESRDRTPVDQMALDYFKHVRRALEV